MEGYHQWICFCSRFHFCKGGAIGDLQVRKPENYDYRPSNPIYLYSDKVAPPPGAALAGKRVLEDPNDEPQYGERIPYVIARGEPGAKLVDRAVPPEEIVYNRCILPICAFHVLTSRL